MNAYDDGQTTRLGALLIRREAELRALLRDSATTAGHAHAGADHEVQDFKDAANDEARAVVDDFQAGHAVLELQQVMAARLRVDRCEFGHCLACGQAINLSRLLALPAAALCTGCQALQEQRGAQ